MKKRILSIVLLLCMLFALSACGTPATTDTGSTDTGSADTGSGDTNSDTSTGGTYVSPILDHDSTRYEAKYADIKKTKIKYGIYSLKVPEITDYYNNYEAAFSMTFDDGYHVETGYNVSSVFEKYGWRGTMMLCPSMVDDKIDGWNNVFNMGYLDVGCHGWDHIDPRTISADQMEHEVKEAIEYLREKFPGQDVLTFATPLAQITDSYEEYLRLYTICNRLEMMGKAVNLGKNDNNLYRVYSTSINTSKLVPDPNFPDDPTKRVVSTAIEMKIDDAIKANQWFVALYHCVMDNAKNSTDMEKTAFEKHCEWLYEKYNGRVWFASYEDVAKYATQKQSATIEYTDCDSESMTFVAKVDQNYGQEMTLKLFVPFFIDSAYAVIDGEEQYVEVIKETGVSNARVIYLNTEISEAGTEIKIVLGGNDKYANNCQHEYVVNEVVAPTADTFGYTEMVCINEECAHTYKKQYTNKLGK